MAIEIERKFLVVSDDYESMASEKRNIVQGYLSANPAATVRVRIVDNERAYITVKGRSGLGGLSRNEWEYPIPVEDARGMLRCCGERVVDKTRYLVPGTDGYTWEVDRFHGRHAGLVIAEIELDSEDATFSKPDFVGEEVTGDKRYYNSQLAGL